MNERETSKRTIIMTSFLAMVVGIALVFGLQPVYAHASAQSEERTLAAGVVSTQAATYKIVFKANGGKGKMGAQIVKRGQKTALAANKFKRSGYKFAGWNTKANGTGKAYKNKAKVKNLAKAGKRATLYARWKKSSKPKANYKLYRPVLERATNGDGEFARWKNNGFSWYGVKGPKYVLFDIDKNGVKELIVSNEDTVGIMSEEIKVYTLRGGQVISSGAVSLLKSGRLYAVGKAVSFVTWNPATSEGIWRGVVELRMDGTSVESNRVWGGYCSSGDVSEPLQGAYGSIGQNYKKLTMTLTSDYSALG